MDPTQAPSQDQQNPDAIKQAVLAYLMQKNQPQVDPAVVQRLQDQADQVSRVTAMNGIANAMKGGPTGADIAQQAQQIGNINNAAAAQQGARDKVVQDAASALSTQNQMANDASKQQLQGAQAQEALGQAARFNEKADPALNQANVDKAAAEVEKFKAEAAKARAEAGQVGTKDTPETNAYKTGVAKEIVDWDTSGKDKAADVMKNLQSAQDIVTNSQKKDLLPVTGPVTGVMKNIADAVPFGMGTAALNSAKPEIGQLQQKMRLAILPQLKSTFGARISNMEYDKFEKASMDPTLPPAQVVDALNSMMQTAKSAYVTKDALSKNFHKAGMKVDNSLLSSSGSSSDPAKGSYPKTVTNAKTGQTATVSNIAEESEASKEGFQ